MFIVALTDYEWFQTIQKRPGDKPVHFFTPGPWNIRKLKEGDLFIFLLKAPYRKIVGYGRFSSYRNETVRSVWAEYGKNTGMHSLQHFMAKLDPDVVRHADSPEESIIGAIELTDVRFFPANRWLPVSELFIDFPDQVMKFKYFSSDRYIEDVMKAEGKGRHVTSGTCGITGEREPALLTAVPIDPLSPDDEEVNGIWLRADLAGLWGEGLVTIAEDSTIRISPFLLSEAYGQYESKQSFLTVSEQAKKEEMLTYHRSFLFRQK